MSKIRITRTQVFEYDPHHKDTKSSPHSDYCERDPVCTDLKTIMAHDREDMENGEYELDDLVREAVSTVINWEIVNEPS